MAFSFGVASASAPRTTAVGSQAQVPRYDSSGRIVGYSPVALASAGNVSKASPVGDYGVPAATGAATSPGMVAPVVPPVTGKDPNQDFNLLAKTKNPAIANATNDLLGQVNNSGKDFQSYLDEAKNQIEQNKAQLAKDKAAFDTGPLESKLATYDKNFVDTMGGLDTKYSGLINDYAGAQQGQVGALQDELRNYETASQGVADRALGYAQKRNSLYQANSGTPTSDSGDMRQRAIQAFLDVNLPLQKELSAARQNVITNVQMPLNREVQGQRVGQVTGFEAPLASTTANLFGGDAKYVASMAAQLAGRSMQESIQYMQSLGVPIQMQQQILQSKLGLLGGITGLDQQNTFYGLSSPYSPEITSLPSYGSGGMPARRAGYGAPAWPVQTGPTPLPKTVNPAAGPAGNPAGQWSGGSNGQYFSPQAREAYKAQAGVYPENDPSYSPELYQWAQNQTTPLPARSGWYTGPQVSAGGAYAGAPDPAASTDYGDFNYQPQYEYQA